MLHRGQRKATRRFVAMGTTMMDFKEFICAFPWNGRSVVSLLLEHHNSNNEVSALFAK